MTLVTIYLTAMYGSNLWDLFSDSANKLFISWNNVIRTAYDLPYNTHRYILEQAHNKHLRTSLLKRFIKFYRKLEASRNPAVITLMETQSQDYRSCFGRNCLNIRREFNIRDVREVYIPSDKRCYPIPDGQQWRLPLISELLMMQQDDLYIDNENFNQSDIKVLLSELCSN